MKTGFSLKSLAVGLFILSFTLELGCTSDSLQSGAVLPANYYAALSGAKSSADLTLASVKEIKAALSLIGPSDPNAAILVSKLADSYPLTDLQAELDLILSNGNLDAAARAKLLQIYQALFGSLVSEASGNGMLIELEGFLFNQDGAKIPAIKLLIGGIEDSLKNLLEIIAQIIADLPKPPDVPNPPAPIECAPPAGVADTSCLEYEDYAQCLSDMNLALCEAGCISQPGGYIKVCLPVTAPPLIVSACTQWPDGEVGIVVPVTGYVCARQPFRRRPFGNTACPAQDLDPNSSATKCSDWDLLKACLFADKQCGPGRVPVEEWVSGVNVTCTEDDGSIGFRPYGRWVCKEVGTPSPPPPPTPGDGRVGAI